jgi:hypothetical protein
VNLVRELALFDTEEFQIGLVDKRRGLQRMIRTFPS